MNNFSLKLCRILIVSMAMFIQNCRKKLDFYSIRKIDAHLHIHTQDSTLIQQAIKDNFRLFTIATRSESQENIDKQLDFSIKLHQRYPETLFFATTFSMENWGQPEWQEKVIHRLIQDFQAGAIAVKIWKDIGMTFRDTDSNFIMITHPSFDSILDFIASENKTLIAHLGEPRNCWLPLDSMTVNNDRNYFQKHPAYHMYLHPDYPSYEEQINARDEMLARHPDLRVVGAHLGSLEWNVDELAKRLDKFPNFAVDMSARICHFQVQNREKVRNFIIKYQDRLLYGTDNGIGEDDNIEKACQNLEQTWLVDWDYFSTDKEMTSPHVNGTFQGLKLDVGILQKIYYENAVVWLPGIKN